MFKVKMSILDFFENKHKIRSATHRRGFSFFAKSKCYVKCPLDRLQGMLTKVHLWMGVIEDNWRGISITN